MAKDFRQVLYNCIRLLLKPIAKLCLKNSIKFQDFAEISKRAFLDSAAEELESLQETPNTSRLSLMTGLQRRDVDRLIEQATSPELEDNVVTRVVGQWVSDRRFSDKRGRPRALRLEGKNSDFAKLVRLISKDLNHYSVLFELERLGLVVRKPDLVRLLAPDHQTKNDFERGFAILSKDASDLIVSVVENLKAENSPPNLHARTEYDNVSEAALPEIRRWFIALGQKVHAEARDFLSKFDRDINPKLREQGPGARVSLGTFSRVETAVRARKNTVKGRGES